MLRGKANHATFKLNETCINFRAFFCEGCRNPALLCSCGTEDKYENSDDYHAENVQVSRPATV